MNTVTDLMLTLSKNDVRIKLSDDHDLIVNAPKGFWNDNPDLLSAMKANKNEIKAQFASKVEQKTLKIVNRSEFDSLSYSQSRMWFHQSVHENNASYNMPMCFRLTGNIKLSRFKKSISVLMNKHESLRMGFKSILGEPKQFILQTIEVDDVLIEQSCRDENSAKIIINKFIKKPFSLDNPPLWRILLLHIDSNTSFLVLCFHHIISDGVSIGLFLNDLIATYCDEGVLCNNPYDYSDYTHWHNQWLNSPLATDQLKYWKNRLQYHRGVEVGDLKGDKQRPLSITFDVTTDTFSLPNNVTLNLEVFCAQHRCTLYSALLAIYVRLSCEYNDKSFLIVGTPVSGRTKSQFDSVIGLFVNTLPLYIEYNKKESYQLFCERLTHQLTLDFNNQDFPFDKIVNALEIKRDISRNPLFQTMFLLEYKNSYDFSLPDVMMKSYPIDLGFGQFDLTLGVSVSPKHIDITMEYNHKIYSTEWINSFKNNFIGLLESVLENPTKPLCYFSVTSSSEINKLISFGKLNEKKSDNKKIVNLAKRIELSARRYAQKIAVKDIYSTYTYRELFVCSNNIANALIKNGIQPGEIVAIKMQRSRKLIAAMLGVWKANATYLPIDPKSPIKRTEYILKDSKSRCVILDDIVDSLNLTSIRAFCFDDMEKQQDNAVSCIQEKVNPAYVIYTSGTTGLPKGVVINHGGLQNLIDIYQETYSLTSDDRFSQFATQAFDAFVCEVWPALSLGASVYIVDEDTKLSPVDLIAFFQKYDITVCDIPTAIAPSIWDESNSLYKMRLMKIGGEKITHYPPANLPYLIVNTYGPTENTVESTYAFLNDNLYSKKQSVLPPIGKPLPGIQCAVLNTENKMVPVGAPGELVLFGEGLADGYLNNIDLTNEKFVDLSFCDDLPAMRGYKTGDIVAWQHDGQLQFIGRKDKQIKVRNFRIETSEIEYALNQIEGVSHAVVTISGEKIEEKIIVSFVIVKNSELSSNSIKLTLRDFLPDYMIPAKIIFVEKIPLTLNGKVDYDKLLLLMKNETQPANQNYVKPKTHLEMMLSEIWSDVLQVPFVGIYDNFFDLGGDSLSSIRISALAKIKGISLKPLHLHKYKTISEIAQRVELSEKQVISRDAENTIVRLSPIQDWFVSQHFRKPAHYNQSLLFIAPYFFNKQIAKQLLRWILSQHSILTMRLSLDNKNYIIRNDITIDDYLCDVVINKDENITQTIQTIVNNVQSQFDLYSGPLFKIIYIHDLTEIIKRVCIVAHHLLIDVASWSILTDDINYFLSHNDTDFSNVNFLPKTTSYEKWIYGIEQLNDNQNFSVIHTSNNDEKINPTFENSKTYFISLGNHFSSPLKKHEFVLLLCARYIGHILKKSVVLVENESHGRFESLVDGCDLTRSIGWFTAIYPISIDTRTISSAAESIIKSRKITDKDKLRFLLSKQYENVIFDFSFNFHGDLRKKNDVKNNQMVSAPEKITETISPLNHRSALFDINTYISEEGLQIEVTAPKTFETKMGDQDHIRNKMKEIMKELL